MPVSLSLASVNMTTFFVSLPSGAACGCTPTLCLRSFVAIAPQNEFRVFFVSAAAVAVSQRHAHQFYPHLHRDIAEWKQRIHHFCTLLASKLPLPSCVVDIAFTEQSPKVRLSSHSLFCSYPNVLFTFSPWTRHRHRCFLQRHKHSTVFTARDHFGRLGCICCATFRHSISLRSSSAAK